VFFIIFLMKELHETKMAVNVLMNKRHV